MRHRSHIRAIWGKLAAMIARAFLTTLVLAAPAWAQDASVAQLKADLLAGNSATVTLGQWCAREKLADPPVIRALRDPVQAPASDAVRALLKVAPDAPLGYRRVKLMCGTHVLSEADNWYVPARLTPAMNQLLQTTDTPFGTAVKALNFHRRTLDAESAPGTVLRVRAVLLTPDETPFSLVVENYTSDLIGR